MWGERVDDTMATIDWLALGIGDSVPVEAREEAEPLPLPGLGEAPWFAAFVRGGCEIDVAGEIRALGLVSYVPMRAFACRKPPHRHVRRREAPLLPNYVLFESVPDLRCWRAVRDIDDVTGIVSNGDVPMRIKAEVIGGLMAAEDLKMFDETVDMNNFEFAAGDVVTIAAGIYQGYEAKVKSAAHNKATVSIMTRDGVREMKVRVDLLKLLA